MDIVYIAFLTIFASGIGTITGFGTSTIMIPILVLFFSFPQVIHGCRNNSFIWKYMEVDIVSTRN